MTHFGQTYGPWALVTGASSGLGSAFAKKLAAKGLNIVLVARREDRLRSLAQELERAASVETRVVAADLSREDFLARIQEATDDLEVGLLVNNAGRATAGEFLANDLDSELGMLHLNARAPLILTHHFAELMRSRRRGGIIFLASVVGLTGVPLWSNYAATKGHSLLFAEGLHVELKRASVDVLAVSPAFIQTEFMDLSSFGRGLSLRPEVVASVAMSNLGKKSVVTPGLLGSLIAFSTRLQPRFLNTIVFGAVVSRARSSLTSVGAGPNKPKAAAG